MGRVIGVLLSIAGVALLLFGLLFVIGSGGQPRRLVIGAVSLALGGVLLGSGLFLFKRADAGAPERLLARILDVARRRNGEVSEAEVLAAVGRYAPKVPDLMRRVIEAGLCERRAKDRTTWYVFEGLQPRLFVRRCQYCGTEVSIVSEAESCPSCRGTLATGVEARAASDDGYRMDE